MKYRYILFVVLLLLLFLPLMATGNAESMKKPTPIVVASILPQQYFIDRIGGTAIESAVLVGVGQSPHSYEPTPKQMTALAQADAWIISRTDFENQLVPKVKALYPGLKIVDGTEGVTFRLLVEDHEHDDNEDDHHDEIEFDKHTWLGRESVKILAHHIKETLIGISEENTRLFNENYQKLITEIDEAYDELQDTLLPLAGKTVFVYHPSFGYLFDDLQIHQRAVETGGKEPTPKTLTELIELAKTEQPPVIFVQSQFPAAAAEKVAQAVNATVIPLDPLAYDWLENIKLIGSVLHDYVEKIK
ncbi:MAG: zinc ABC transporter substrate-binding protein [Sphaerochaetaceae bacterium]|nr:zinc ABC transporter substrate-binding protein [Sphaerochaetaceae bacterium]MDD2405703.1 zinc ABC transporter substrate-binding protein [Sphaerochaetaceae bacterium]MDD4258770.1 zinc ABC transporter substrate-binding protein [Sphaerochaetaceae bacterium]MDD5075969.1 zinc ABC transporter substrate-binding protein [Sphaerochaetaceae bacterium]NLO60360.1 zinc ABC transporter solute-binding protein [Spirochaetales bacterium]